MNSHNKKTAGKLVVIAMLMFGFGFALVPLYSLVCDAFGINGRFLEIESGEFTAVEGERQGELLARRVDKDRTVNVQFFTTVNQNMDWKFKALDKSVKVHPGEITEVRFYAKNMTDKDVVAQAIPSLQPSQAIKYFTKMECFCFTQQTLRAGEGREMPLKFVVNPDLPKNIGTITLAYTFFDTGLKAKAEQKKNVALVNQ
ncbi:MAG: cytochrome c oxidase assembly protein [Proteobacteria bacterium]|nr:cytochrome c oxidase assembly protein [Pseudomonadota bacterium]